MTTDASDQSQPRNTAAAPPIPPPPERRNPYVGPRAFQTGEALYGRNREIDDLFDLLVARRIVLLYAPSGAGKTSLVQAGLIPRLRAEGFFDLPVVRVNAPEPGATNRYLGSVIASLRAGAAQMAVPAPSSATGESPAAPERLRERPGGAEQVASLDAYLAERESNLPGSPVLILDQFEEIFTMDPTDIEAKRAFFAAIGSALQKPNRWALFVMREEFIGALEPYARYIPTRLATTMRLDLLGVAAARDAIQKPAETVMEDAAADALVEDLRVVRVQQPDGSVQRRQGPYIEPSQLQVVCYRLWQQPRPDPRRITAADVMAVASGTGAVDAALAGYYADRVAAIAQNFTIGERLVREWFERRLITPQGVRALVLREPDGAAADGRMPDAVIRALVDAHLVRAEERRGVTWYELAHDRLIEPVRQNNRVWAEEHLHALQRGADVWNQQGRNDGFLLSGKALEDAASWAAAHAAQLTALDQEYLRESRQVADALAARQERERQVYELDAARRIAASERTAAETERAARRRQSVLTVVLAVVALLALAAFGFSLWQTAEANLHRDLAREAEAQAAEERDKAQKASTAAAVQRDTAVSATSIALARELASNATLQLDSDPELSILLALESLRRGYTPEADSVAWQAASKSYLNLTFNSDEAVDQALYSPDGKRVLTIGRQTPAQGRVANPAIWDAESGKTLFQLVAHQQEVTDASWSPDGRRIATASTDNSAIIWDGTNGRQLTVLGGARADVTRVVWSRDGRRLAVAHRPGFVRIYDAASGRSLHEMTQQGDVRDLAWGPGDRLLATVGTDRLLHIWDMESGRSVRALSGHTDSIRVVAWNAGGDLVATGSTDGTARIWSLEQQGSLAVLPGHRSAVSSLAWHPKENALVTGDGGGMGRIWRAPSGELLRELSGHWSAVNAIAFTAGGERVATAAEDGTARVWYFENGFELINLRGHHGSVNSVMFSPDAKHLLTGSSDLTARIWNVAQPAWVTISLGRSLGALTWSADGTQVAIAADDKVLLWNALTNIDEDELSPGLPVRALAFSPVDKRLAVGTDTDGENPAGIIVYNLASGAEVLMSPRLEGDVKALAWSPDGRRIASISADDTGRIWDAATGKQILLIKVVDPLPAIAWSRDGRYIAAAAEGFVHLWEAQNGQTVGSLDLGDAGRAVRQFAFSPDSRLLLIPGEGRIARAFDVPSGVMRFEVPASDSVSNTIWNPNGQQIAVGGAEGTIHLGNAANGRIQRDLLVPKHQVLSMAYSPDGKRLATVHNDDSLRFFMTDLEEMKAYAQGRISRGRVLTCPERVRYLHENLTCPK